MARASAPDQVSEWARSVVAGKVTVGRYVRLACERHLRDLREGPRRGLRWDVDRSERAVAFFSKLKHSKGRWAGEPFVLSPWQAFIVGSLFGWLHADGTRRFRVAYNEIPRKNGKSTLAAGLAIFMAFFDGEAGAEVFCAATKRDQAKIVFSEAKRMVLSTPALRRRIGVLVGNLNVQKTGSKLEPLGADADSMDGLNPHAVIIDELHAHKTAAMVDVLQSASGAREQPLRFEITTAGYDRTSVCWKHHDYSIKVLEGLKDDSWFAFIAAMDADDDWTDPKSWAKANLNLGVSVNPDYLAAECKRAQSIAAEQNTFRRLHGNQWTEQSMRAIDMATWDLAAAPIDPESLRGRFCLAGLDMGSVNDITAKVSLFPDGDGGYDLLCRFWVPEGSLESGSSSRSEEMRRRLSEWADAGWITVTPGNVTDYDHVEQDILDDAEGFDLREVAYDRWNISQLVTHLQEEWGEGDTARVRLVPIGQGFQSMSGPTKEFLRLVAAGKIRHGGNPVLRWMVSNLALRQDPAGNLKPDRERSADKIDGVAALVMALARAIVSNVGSEAGYDRAADDLRARREAAGEAPSEELIDAW